MALEFDPLGTPPVSQSETPKKRQIQVQLIQALGIMGVKSGTLNNLSRHGKSNEIKEILSQRMTELTQDLSKLGMEDFKKGFDPDLNVNDFSAVHEAYQYLVVEYVEKVINYL